MRINKFNLLKFDADGGNQGGSNNQTPPNDPNQADPKKPDNNNEPEKKYSDQDVDAIVKKKLAKWKADEQAKLDALEEAKKLEQMSADDKTKYQLDKLKKEADEAKLQAAKYEMEKVARKSAEEMNFNLSEDDLAHIVTAEAETTQNNLTWLRGVYERVSDQIKKEYLSGNPPKNFGNKLNKKKGGLGERLAGSNTDNSKRPSPFN